MKSLNPALLSVVLGLTSAAALAQTPGAHAGHPMADAPAPMPKQSPPAANAPMDHGEMRMQGGAAPDDARDPHAYSGGHTLDAGPYSLAGPRQLRLADEHAFSHVRLDRLERVDTRDATATVYDAQARFGRDYTKLVVKAEGDYANRRLHESHTEVRYSRAITSYWDAQIGLAYDTAAGPDRQWLAVGVQGLAPYWFEVDATAYLGSNGRSALSVEAEYDLLLTQLLPPPPRAELAMHGKADRANGLGSGLTDGAVGLRLRYEITRQFAPYIGVEWGQKFGQTADEARAAGEPTRETRYMLGLSAWF